MNSQPGCWLPLNEIQFGLCKCEFNPLDDTSGQIPLERGSSVYCFEQYSNGTWLRGYSLNSNSNSVVVGIFPANSIRFMDDYGITEEDSPPIGRNIGSWGRMESLKEEDESILSIEPVTSRESIASPPKPVEDTRPPPPIPSLRYGDETSAAGETEVIIDEITAALKEWSSLLYAHLENQNYKLFNSIKSLIDDLHAGRRRLLMAQDPLYSLSMDELAELRGEMVEKLVQGNIEQGLEVIVRHPHSGGLVDVNAEGDIDRQSWMSAVRMYTSQVALACGLKSDLSDGGLPPRTTPAQQISFVVTSPTFSQLPPAEPLSTTESTSLAHHILIELRAFASPLTLGDSDTTELCFSLFSKNQFISEDFIIHLDSKNKPQFDQNCRVLFENLTRSEIQEDIYLVCRIIKNETTSGTSPRDTFTSSTLSLSGRSQTSSFVSETGVEFELGTRSGMLRLDKNGRQSVRKPFGCAVLLLPRGLVESEDELDMPILIAINEANFSILPESIIASKTTLFESPPRAGRILINAKNYHSTLASLRMSGRLINVEECGRLSLPDVVLPDLVLNNVYLTLSSGDFSNKNVEISVEIRTKEGALVDRVISRNGESSLTQYNSIVFSTKQPVFGEMIKIGIPVEIMESCHIFFSFRSRLSKDNRDKPFAFAYLPLANEKVFLADNSHSLALYKYDKSCASSPKIYFQAPPTTSNLSQPLPASLAKVIVPVKDSFVVKSRLVSTKFTQNSVLLKFLNSSGLNVEELKEVLTNLRFCDEVEVCKFLRDIFDTLFAILISSQKTEELEDLIFSNLVNILNIFGDRRFTNFKPVVDSYIQNHLASSAASSHILKGLQKLLKESTTKSDSGPILRSAIKNWHYLLKFALRSRQIQRAKDGVGSGVTSSHLEESFKKELSSLLTQINTLMRSASPAILGTQTLAVIHFSEILEDLANCYSSSQLIEIAVAFVDAIHAKKGKIVISSIVLQNQLVAFFDSSAGRNTLVPNIVRWSKASLGKFDEFTQCSPKDSPTIRDGVRVAWIERIRLQIGVIAVILDQLHASMISLIVQKNRALIENEQDNLEYLLGLLPLLQDSFRELQNPATLTAVGRQRSQTAATSKDPICFPSTYPFSLLSSINDELPSLQNALGDIACIIIVLLHLSPQKIIMNHLETTLAIGKVKFARELSSLFQISKAILDNEAFPYTWLNVNILAHQVCIDLIDSAADILIREFIPDSVDEFDLELWISLFSMLLKTIASPQLTIEDFSPQKRRAVWKLTGDLRGVGARLLGKLWNRIGVAQVELVGLAGDIAGLALSPHDELRGTAIEILSTMIVNQYDATGNFTAIEAEIIDRLDDLYMTEAKADEVSRSLFVEQLRILLDRATIDDILREQVDAFLARIQEFLELLLAVTNLPDGDEYQEDRIMSTLKLMSFIRGIGKSEIYVRYVNRLVAYHVALGNSVQAGLTLKLHADLYDWSNEFVEPLPELSLPRQTSFARKENLYVRIWDHLARGGAFETAIALTKELQHEYESNRFDFVRLSSLLTLQSSFYSKITTTNNRDMGEFYRVAYYGVGFPTSLSGKQFIYHSPLKNPNFIQSFLDKHPNSQLLTSHEIPPDTIQFEEARWIQITKVEAVPEEGGILDRMRASEADSRILDWYLKMETKRFSFERIVKREMVKEVELNEMENEFLSSWTERTTLISETRFPSILLRADVLEIRLLSVSPLSVSVTTLYSQLASLQGLEKRYLSLAEQGISKNLIDSNPLSLRLNFELDRPEGTGIPLWRDVFLRGQEIEPGGLLSRLSEGIDEFVISLQRCLKLHSLLCPSEMRSFHEILEGFLEKNFSNEIARLPVVILDLPYSIPLDSPGFNPSEPYRQTSLDMPRSSSSTNPPVSPGPKSYPLSVNYSNGNGTVNGNGNGNGLKRGNSILNMLGSSRAESVKSMGGSISKKSILSKLVGRREGSLGSNEV